MIKFDHFNLFKFAIEYFGNIKNLLLFTSKTGNIKYFKFLYHRYNDNKDNKDWKDGNDIWFDLFINAVSFNNFEIFDFLYNKINYTISEIHTIIFRSIECNNIKILKYLYEKELKYIDIDLIEFANETTCDNEIQVFLNSN